MQITNLNNRVQGKNIFSIWKIALKHNTWKAAQQDSERDNERQFNFSHFLKEMSRKLNLKGMYSLQLYESDLP